MKAAAGFVKLHVERGGDLVLAHPIACNQTTMYAWLIEADWDALARTCDTARALAGDGRVIVVFGAGGETDAGKRGPMGAAVGSRADDAVITTDNPRRESPAAIAGELADGVTRGGRAGVRLEADRRSAIALAIATARDGDVVVVAGKGHETGQEIGDETLPFSDRDEVRALLGRATEAA